MERTDILELMSTLKLYGMRAAYDEVMTTGIKRRHEPPRILGELLSAEIAEKQARSIKYQLTIAKLPLAKDVDDFDFTGTPINQALIRDLATGGFIAEQRNAVLIGDRKSTRLNSSHMSISYAVFCLKTKRIGAASGSPCKARYWRTEACRFCSLWKPTSSRSSPGPKSSIKFVCCRYAATSEAYTLSLHDALPI